MEYGGETHPATSNKKPKTNVCRVDMQIASYNYTAIDSPASIRCDICTWALGKAYDIGESQLAAPCPNGRIGEASVPLSRGSF